ncbi:MAG: glycosyltransferase [Bacteroidetes bacterium]|nr:glycosyltransferase [Bacteroidota bacterium]
MDKSKIKIACVGNMNNSMFSIVRHLRYAGYNAELILSKEFSHFQPDADTFEEINTDFIIESDFLNSDILYTKQLKLNNFFSKYNFIIACGYSIAYLTFAKIKIDVVIPYGSDLYELPFFEIQDVNNTYFNKQRAALAKYQKLGIENATGIIFDYTNEEFEKTINLFNLKGKRYKYPSPFIYTPEFNWQNSKTIQTKSSLTSKMLEIKKKFDFIAFSHIRQSWKNPIDIWSYKGNERIFRGFKNFLELTNANACIIVFEYGSDVEDSKKLIVELGLEKNVIWFPTLERKNILSMISFIDVGIGEVGDYSWLSYGAIFEFLCMQKPVIHNRKDSLYEKIVDSLYPMYSAANEEEVTKALISCFQNKEHANKIAVEANEWYVDYAINKPLAVLTSILEKKGTVLPSFEKKMSVFLLKVESLAFFLKLKLNL